MSRTFRVTSVMPRTSAVAAIKLSITAADLARIEAAMPAAAVAGERYVAALMTHLDSEHA